MVKMRSNASGHRSHPGWKCVRPSRATRREQRRRCAGTKWPPKTSSFSCTRVPSITIRSIRTEAQHGSPRRPTISGKWSPWPEGFRYSKCGVMITELMPETIRQPALWGELDREKREWAWRAMDKLNANLGRDTARILGVGPKEAAWKLRAEHRSPRWTTRWDELPKASAK